MNGVAKRTPLLSVEDYLELEASSSIRHEYVDGHLFALAGVTNRHNNIVVNIISRLHPAARQRNYQVRSGAVRLRVSSTCYYYPDVQIVCNPPGPISHSATEPSVIVEVVSPSTEQIDQREKLFAYRTIDALRAYYIVHQDSMTVENHWCDDDGTWWHGRLHGGGALHVPCLNFDLPLEHIYEGVNFEQQ